MNPLAKLPPKPAECKPMTGPLVVGEWYLAPCIQDAITGKWMPVLPNAHVDEGLDVRHYNFDVRFLTRRQVCVNIRPLWQTVLAADERPIEFKPRLCLRVALPFGYMHGLTQKRFENECRDGRLMRNMRCPHAGTDLSTCPIDADGTVTCPAHGVRWHVGSGRMAPIQTQGKNQ